MNNRPLDRQIRVYIYIYALVKRGSIGLGLGSLCQDIGLQLDIVMGEDFC